MGVWFDLHNNVLPTLKKRPSQTPNWTRGTRAEVYDTFSLSSTMATTGVDGKVETVEFADMLSTSICCLALL